MATVEDHLCGGNRKRCGQPSLGPRAQIRDDFCRFLGGDTVTRTAIVCHAFDNETPIGCRGRGEWPFGLCMVYPKESNGALLQLYLFRKRAALSHRVPLQKSQIKAYNETGGSVENWKINARPDGQPSATADPLTVERNDRYSCGSHNTFSEFHVIHAPSGLMP